MVDTPTQWGVLLGRGFARLCGWLRFGGKACAAAAVHGRVVSWGWLDGEKTRAVPNRPGNRPRDRRQAGIGGALPDIALGRDHDGVTAALIVADQHRSDLEVAFALAGAIAAGEAVQQFEGGAIERAEGLFLNPVGDHPPQQVYGQASWKRASELGLPAPPQRSAR